MQVVDHQLGPTPSELLLQPNDTCYLVPEDLLFINDLAAIHNGAEAMQSNPNTLRAIKHVLEYRVDALVVRQEAWMNVHYGVQAPVTQVALEDLVKE